MPLREGVVLSLARMRKIIDVDPYARTVDHNEVVTDSRACKSWGGSQRGPFMLLRGTGFVWSTLICIATVGENNAVDHRSKVGR
jgi:hypothetical protein